MDSKQQWTRGRIHREGGFQLGEASLALLTRNADAQYQAIGTGQLIWINGRHALCVTAAHNLKGVRDWQRPRTRHHASTPSVFLPDQKPLHDEIRLDWMLGSVMTAEHVIPCKILNAFAPRDLDICLLTVAMHEGCSLDTFPARITLDTRPPNLGEEMLALSYRDMQIVASHVSADRQQFRFGVSYRREVLKGRVTELRPHGGLLDHSPSFELSIPSVPQMSGGFVGRILPKQEDESENTIALCGIISSDMSMLSTKTEDMYVAGHTNVAMVLPLTEFPLPFILKDELGNDLAVRKVRDLIRLGHLPDYGRADQTVRVVQDEHGRLHFIQIQNES